MSSVIDMTSARAEAERLYPSRSKRTAWIDSQRRIAHERGYRSGFEAATIPPADRCECGSTQGPFIYDRDYCLLCPACAEDSRLCMKRTFGGVCGEKFNHDGPCIRDEELA